MFIVFRCSAFSVHLCSPTNDPGTQWFADTALAQASQANEGRQAVLGTIVAISPAVDERVGEHPPSNKNRH
jgi:hypothetical protein